MSSGKPAVRSALRAAACVAALSLGCAGLVPAVAQTMGDRNMGQMRSTGPGGMWDNLRFDRADDSIGMRVFREGVLPGGGNISARRGDAAVTPDQAVCANCHQRSGLGASEGQQPIPPVTAAALFSARPQVRPAYDDRTLARAIRDGVDAGGRELSPVMPRYGLDAPVMSGLIAYLKTLEAKPSPGISDSVVHLATVVGEGVPDGRRQAMLEVMQSYIEEHNARAAGQAAGTQAALRWQLDVWPLSGTAAERRARMVMEYRKQPVLALVGGLTRDTWLPQHQFCEEFKVACLFPDTELPVSSMPAFYAVYYDKGSILAAQVLARHFMDRKGEFATGRIVQVLPRNWFGYEPAAALRGAFGRAGARRILDQVVEEHSKLPAGFWQALLQGGDVAAIVLWMDDPDLSGLAALAAGGSLPPVFLAGSRDPGLVASADPALRERLRMVLPRDPGAAAPAAADWLRWMDARGLAVGDAMLQANAWFVMRLLDEALRTSGSACSAERLIERIEYSAGTVVPHPLLPSLSLGMGQRFAVKGGYVLAARGRGDAGTAGGAAAPVPLTAGEWIVP